MDFTLLKKRIYINDKLYDTGIDVLELSVRANNCLENAGYTTLIFTR